MRDMTHPPQSGMLTGVYRCDMASFTYVTQTHLYVRHVHSCVWHDSFVWATWLIHFSRAYSWEYTNVLYLISLSVYVCVCSCPPPVDTWYTRIYLRTFSRVCCVIQYECAIPHFICKPWLMSCMWHDSFYMWHGLIHMRNLTHSHVWHDSFTCVTWLIHMCDMTCPPRQAYS